jgi:hypothetical protein
MTKRLSRQQLYDLVWSTPMWTLAKQFKISDDGLKSTCARAVIPTPIRGYWAKREAGKPTIQVALPKRAPGMADQIVVGGGNGQAYYSTPEEELRGPVPPPPEFPEPIEAVRERIAAVVGTVTVPQRVKHWHPMVDQLIKEDERRREQQRSAPYRMSWEVTRFDSLVERRRLLILNALFLAVTKMDGRPAISNYEPRSIQIIFFQQHVGITLERPARVRGTGQNATKRSDTNDTILSLSILQSINSQENATSWQDEDSCKLEALMTEISVEVILTAERQYRDSEIRRYEWRVKRKAELEEQDRQRKTAAERAARERQQRIEKARVDRLLKDATAFRQANDIRRYVDALRTLQAKEALTSPEEFDHWSAWALAQADRVDPATGGSFTGAMQDQEDGDDN